MTVIQIPKKTWLNAVDHYTSLCDKEDNVSPGQLTTTSVLAEYGLLYVKTLNDDDVEQGYYNFAVVPGKESMSSAFMLKFS
jgi:hypothetical protein